MNKNDSENGYILVTSWACEDKTYVCDDHHHMSVLLYRKKRSAVKHAFKLLEEETLRMYHADLCGSGYEDFLDEGTGRFVDGLRKDKRSLKRIVDKFTEDCTFGHCKFSYSISKVKYEDD